MNRTRDQIGHGRAAFGCFLRYPDAALAEYLALRGLDFIIFDGEHGTLTPPVCEHMVRAVELHGVTPGVRVEENRSASLLRYLDTGVLNCHVPGVESAADAVRAARSARFRPDGDRGLSASRASAFGTRESFADYTARANRETQVIVHIESRAGVDAVDEIAAVRGIDVLFVGTLDLSHDLGFPGDLAQDEIRVSAERVASAARSNGKALGAMATSALGVRAWTELGAHYLMTTVEALLAPGIRGFLASAPETEQ